MAKPGLNRKDFLFFFGGVDPAPSEQHTSDDGAIVVACAQPRVLPCEDNNWEMPTSEAQWYFDYIYARRLTYRQKATIAQWSGLIHTLHRAYRFSRIVMDPNGGGTYVKRALLAEKQLINGVETMVTPISDMVDGPKLVTRGDFILHMFRPKDPGIDQVWPEVGHSDNLNDAMYAQMKEDLDNGYVGLPPSVEDWLSLRRDEVAKWPPEKQWSMKCLTAMANQLQSINVAMAEDGETYTLTARGARQFSATGKKDLGLAGMFARVAFLGWMKSADFISTMKPEDAVGFGYAEPE